MTRGQRGLLATLLAAVCIAGAGVAGLVMKRLDAPPGPPAALIPPAWSEYRTSLGHTQHVGKGSIGCNDCHDYEREGFVNPGVEPCAQCHAKEASHSHHGDDATKTDCLTCHEFAPKKAAPSCIGCHAEKEGPMAAIQTHAKAECTACHRPHEQPSVVVQDCRTCHADVSSKHTGHEGTAACQDCHKPHTPAVAALGECAKCHDGKSATLAPQDPKPAGHDSCTTCHEPHDFAAQTSVCVDCHGKKPTLMASTIPAHDVCTTCHQPHAPQAAADSCASCHAEIHVSHLGAKACVTCHAPHSGDVDKVAASCTSCHTTVGTSDISAHAGKTPCEGCHKPHDFAPPTTLTTRAALCSSCHEREATAASSNHGHADCTSCHGTDAHKPAPAPACKTCHAKEEASAPVGHRDCQSCHEPHSGARTPKASSCTGCHADKVGVLHGAPAGPEASATHAANPPCTSCHRAHGPSGVAAPPSCASCHTREQLPALHAIAGHAECKTCHTSHEPARSDRATCTTSCHADRREHQPQAPVCSGCHAFRQ
jgi:predicted CXXCH cytochrome family protein